MLEIESLSKRFVMHTREDARVDGFSGVSLTALPGRLLAVTGPSGAGKSSLLKCVYRTYTPSEGRAVYRRADGSRVDLASAPPFEIIRLRKTEIGYVSQFFSVIPRVSALDILISAQTARGVLPAEARERASGMLTKVGIPESLWNMYPATFSGGEKQRLNIVNALITRPRFLLLDEPTASLDARSRERVIELILELKRQGAAMLGVFHDEAAIRALADDRYEMPGKPAEPCRHEVRREVFA